MTTAVPGKDLNQRPGDQEKELLSPFLKGPPSLVLSAFPLVWAEKGRAERLAPFPKSLATKSSHFHPKPHAWKHQEGKH